MTGRAFILIVCLCAVGVHAQDPRTDSNGKTTASAASSSSDDLLKHLTAADSHQRSGDRTNAAIENSTVLGIALQRLGNIAIEEGKYTDAVRILTDSLKYADTASNR